MAVDMWPVHCTHAVIVSRRCYDRICTLKVQILSSYIQCLRMKLSMKNKFPNHILFPEIPTFFEITANQTLFIVLTVLYLFT